MERESQNSRTRQSRFEPGPQPDRINQQGTSIEKSIQELQMSTSLCAQNDALQTLLNDSDEKELLDESDSYGMFLGQRILKISLVKRWELVPKTTLIQFKFKGKSTKLYCAMDKNVLVGLISTHIISNFESLRRKKAIFYKVRKYNNSMISISVHLNPTFKLEHQTEGIKSFRRLFEDLGYQLTKPATISEIFNIKEPKNSIRLDSQTVDKTISDSFASTLIDPKEASKKISDAMTIENHKPDLKESQRSQDGTDTLDMHVELDAVEKLTSSPTPPEFTFQLRTYQKEGLCWMLAKEGKRQELDKPLQSDKDLSPTIEEWTTKKGNKVYLDIQNAQILTDLAYSEQIRGGILADGAGLGKKVMTLALILSNPWKKDLDFLGSNITQSQPIQGLSNQESNWESFHPSRSDHITSKRILGGTLIVCPSTHEVQWKTGIDKHTEKSSLKVLCYGDSHQKYITADMIPQNDVVIISYDSLSKDHQGILTSIYWHRVVLDEAYFTEKTTDLGTIPVFKLESKYRWILSRTPIQQLIGTLCTKLKFLMISPWALRKLGSKNFISQAQFSPELLYSVLRPIILWRTEEHLSFADQKAIRLPPITMEVRYITLQQDEKETYQEAKKEIKLKLHELAKENTSITKRAIGAKIDFLVRKIMGVCDHPFLQFKRRLRELVGFDAVAPLKAFLQEKGINLDINEAHLNIPEIQNGISTRSLLAKLNSLQKDQVENCPICLSQPEQISFTVCGHTHCRECFSRAILYKRSCPCCKADIRDGLFFDRIWLDVESIINKRSSKVDALITSIFAIERNREKCICFTHFSGIKDILALELNKNKIKYVMIEESFTKEKNYELLKEFSEKPEITVALMSLMPSSIESDLTQANHVLFVEPWWNRISEEQLIERVHRSGQTKPVFVTKFACKDTIEERMLNSPEYNKKTSNITPQLARKYFLDFI